MGMIIFAMFSLKKKIYWHKSFWEDFVAVSNWRLTVLDIFTLLSSEMVPRCPFILEVGRVIVQLFL